MFRREREAARHTPRGRPTRGRRRRVRGRPAVASNRVSGISPIAPAPVHRILAFGESCPILEEPQLRDERILVLVNVR